MHHLYQIRRVVDFGTWYKGRRLEDTLPNYADALRRLGRELDLRASLPHIATYQDFHEVRLRRFLPLAFLQRGRRNNKRAVHAFQITEVGGPEMLRN